LLGDSQETPHGGDLLWRQAPSGGLLNCQPLHEKELSINNENKYQRSQTIPRAVRDITALQTPPHAVGYKTGDLARWLAGGVLEFLGRVDGQVKIRGFRVELGEIESRLLEQGEVGNAAVLDREDDGGRKYLCAFIVFKKDSTGEGGKNRVNRLRDHLASLLPAYMIPSRFVEVKEIPVTSTGKVDIKALLRVETGPLEFLGKYIAPSNDLEKAIESALKGLLNLDRVGIEDNFFDIGANSMDLVKLKTVLKDSLKMEIDVVTLFQYSSIARLSGYLSQERAIETRGIPSPNPNPSIPGKEDKNKEESRIDESDDLLLDAIDLLQGG